MHSQPNSRRSYGSGSLFERRGSWYGKWHVAGRRVQRKVGPMRTPERRDGLTRPQAERELRRLMAEVAPEPPRERITVGDVGERYTRHLETLGRKRSTVGDYRSYLRVHLAPHFGSKSLEKIGRVDVEAFIQRQTDRGLAPKSTRLHLSVLHGVFEFAIKRGWAGTNPVKQVERPQDTGTDQDIKFLDADGVEALLRKVPEDLLGTMERPLYLTAAMTGLRQGELLALRWRDLDWGAMRVRVRRNYVRGDYGTPKSKRGSRSVPLADRVAAELDRHFQRSVYQGDDDRCSADPETGRPMDKSKLLKRFKKARDAAGVTPITFHGLRHTFATAMAGAGVPMRILQEWMGHRDFATTLIYADYAPSAGEAELVERAFGAGPVAGPVLAPTPSTQSDSARLNKPVGA